MSSELNLVDLKQRLASLGVHIAKDTDGRSLPYASQVAGKSVEPAKTERKGKSEVQKLLDRCERVEAAISSPETVDHQPVRQKTEQAKLKVEQGTSGARIVSKKARSVAKQAARPPVDALLAAPAQLQARSRPVSSPIPRPSSPARSSRIHVHTPVSSVLAQYRDAEAAWQQEKAKLRREALLQRKRGNKAELECKRLQRLNEQRLQDARGLKAALIARDHQLQQAEARVTDLEELMNRSQQETAEKLATVCSERDDLKVLLIATLERLESVDHVVSRADVSSTMLEDRVRALEQERARALEAATAARNEVQGLTESRRRLQWQSKLLEKMSEVQLRHSRKKNEAIRMLLNTDSSFDPFANSDDVLDDTRESSLQDLEGARPSLH